MATSAGGVLHEYKTTFALWLMPLFFVIGCLLVAMAVGLPLLLKPPSDVGLWASAGIAGVCGVGMPILAVALWLFIPAIVTTYDASGRALVLEYRRPFSRSVKRYGVDEIQDIRPVSSGERTYSLTMVLKSGKHVRLEYSGNSNTSGMEAAAARIKAAIGLGGGPREIRV
jgi:hypothetical protein